jgi:phosphate transporter
MVQERRREDGNLKVVTADGPLSIYEKTHGKIIHTPCGNIPIPYWLSGKAFICLLAIGVLVGIVVGQPFAQTEESNCLGMLVFCTILWATEVRSIVVCRRPRTARLTNSYSPQAIPLFVTSFFVPFLVVGLRLIKSTDGQETRLSASDATK